MMERLAQRIMAIGALSLLALAALAGAPERAAAQNLEPVSVIVFPGGFNWPIWVAQEKGYFAKGGIEVKLTPTPNSVFQLTSLIEGKFDIGATAIDNVIAYMEARVKLPSPDSPIFSYSWGATAACSASPCSRKSRLTRTSRGKRSPSMQ